MYQIEIKKYRTSLILAAAVAGAGLMAGCATNQPMAEAPVPAHQWDAQRGRRLPALHRPMSIARIATTPA